MKIGFPILLFFLIVFKTAASQSVRYPLAQPFISLSAYSSRQTEPLSFTGNQAALAQTRSTAAAVYGERRFMLKEITSCMAGVSFPTSLGNIGIQLDHAGFSNFSENTIGLAYGRYLGKKAAVGIQFNYYGYRVPGYGNAASINFEMGLLLSLTENLRAGIHIYNPVGGKLASGREKIASAYKTGFGYDASEDFFLAAEIIKEEGKAVSLAAGFQYRFANQFFLRGGLLTGPGSVFAGAGLGWKELQLHVSVSYHLQLGFSPGLLLIMNFKAHAK